MEIMDAVGSKEGYALSKIAFIGIVASHTCTNRT